MNFAVIQFPGSNCDQDCVAAINGLDGLKAQYVWHKETSLNAFDAIVLPGGFSYGDYLRCGAIARFSPIMRAVGSFAADGGLVFGICNGFQILTERSEEHTSELQSLRHLVCRLLLEKKKTMRS